MVSVRRLRSSSSFVRVVLILFDRRLLHLRLLHDSIQIENVFVSPRAIIYFGNSSSSSASSSSPPSSLATSNSTSTASTEAEAADSGVGCAGRQGEDSELLRSTLLCLAKPNYTEIAAEYLDLPSLPLKVLETAALIDRATRSRRCY